MAPPPPTWPQTVLSTLLLLSLSLATLPFSLAACTVVYARARFLSPKSSWIHYSRRKSDARKHVALVNGGRMQKALTVARALAAQGYTVIGVEEAGWGAACGLRFSTSVHRFHTVPRADESKEGYISALVDIARRERVTLFVPCSGAGTTIEDAVAAAAMRKDGVETIIQDPDFVQHLHEKEKFITLVQDCGLDVPETHVVSSIDELLEVLRTPDRPPLIIKVTNALDDLARSDMTTYPLLKAGKPDWEATRRRLESLRIPICSETPYIAQEFIGGSGVTEWCTHATVIDGRIRSFVCCPSNDMLMTYSNATYSHLGARALAWTEDFLRAIQENKQWRSTRLCGEFSIDFMHQPDQRLVVLNTSPDAELQSGRLVAIECNPRVHTAIVLLASRKNLGATFVRDASVNKDLARTAQEHGKGGKGARDRIQGSPGQGGRPSDTAPLQPNTNQRPVSWLGHDLPARWLSRAVPRFLREAVHPYWTLEEVHVPNTARRLYDAQSTDTATFIDPSWDALDPWPFFALYHLHWPCLLLHQLFVRRRRWSRINVSTSRIFEC